MAWVKLDDHLDEHPKIARLGDSAFALFIAGLAYCNRNLTDGFIPHMVGLGQLRWCEGNTTPPIRELEATGLWEVVDGGWRVHDYEDYQPSRESVLVEREAARQRKERSRAKSRQESQRDTVVSLAPVTPPPVPDPVPVPKSEDSLAPKPARDEVWDTLAELFGEPTTTSNRTLRGKVVKSLANAGASDLEIRKRISTWGDHFEAATLTETALEKHWDRLGRPVARKPNRQAALAQRILEAK